MTPIEFLKARLDEDEAAANANDGAQWPDISGDDDFGYRTWRDEHGELIAYSDSLNEPLVQHMSRHDPARVLADVAAKRRILALRDSWVLQAEKAPADFRHVFEAQVIAADVVVRSLASAWFNHPDYDPEWSGLRDVPTTSD